MKTATIRAITIALGLLLSGCALSGLTPGAGQGAPVSSSQHRAEEGGHKISIAVAPPDGPALPMARLLAKAAARALTERGITAYALKNAEDPPGAADYLLTGRAVRNLYDARVRYTVLIHWTLRTGKGKLVGRTVQGVPASWQEWEYGDPKLIRFLGHDIVPPVTAMIAARAKAALPVEPLSEGFIFTGVDGAPGDGDKVLARAMIAALRARDILITSDPRQAAFSIHGQVRVARQGASDKITIVWRVSTLRGQKVGQALQANTIPTGTLNGLWEKNAKAIAKAGADGIIRIFNTDAPTIDKERARPPAIRLRPVPGRAPPPPG